MSQMGFSYETVKISQVLDDAQVSSLAVSPDSGASSPGAYPSCVPATPSSKTSQASSAAAMPSQPVTVARPDETSSPTMPTSSASSMSKPTIPENTWKPPMWPAETRPSLQRNAMSIMRESELFAFLADGLWTTGQKNLCTSRGWEECSATWPLSGTMRNGNVYLRPPLAPRTSGTGPSSWPTPTVSDIYTDKLMLPTPTASLGEATQGRGAETTNHDTVKRLREAGILPERKMFPTPMASEAGKSEHTLNLVLAGESQMTLDRFVRIWPTPMAEASQFRQPTGINILRARVDAGEMTREEAEAMAGGSLEPARMKSWPTPCTKDADFGAYTAEQREAKDQQVMLCNEVLRGIDERPSEATAVGQLSPNFVEWLMGFPRNWTETGGPDHGKKTDARADEVLPDVRHIDAAEAVQGPTGRHEDIPETEILRQALCVESPSWARTQFSILGKALQEGRLRDVWDAVAAADTPSGRGSDEQLAGQLADALRDLPHEAPLEDRKESVAQASAFLRGLRTAFGTLCVLSEARHPCAEIWLALPDEEKDWAFLVSARGGNIWITEPPNQARVSVNVPDRVDRLRCLGNAVVPQVAHWIGRCLMADAGLIPADGEGGSGDVPRTKLWPTPTASDAKASGNDGFSPLGRAAVRDNPRRQDGSPDDGTVELNQGGTS